MTSDYKQYSLDKLKEWVHDALSVGEASPHEIYSAIREAVQEDYQYYKDHSARAFGLLELMSGHRPVADYFGADRPDYYKNVAPSATQKDMDQYSTAYKGPDWSSSYVKKDDGMRPWGHSDLEYQIANKDKVSSCDKDDKSPECQKAWNDFWEEYYYPEEYNKSVNLDKEIEEIRKQGGYEWTPIAVKDKAVRHWVLPVEEVKDEDTDENVYCVSFPDDLLEAANLKEGDLVEWVDNEDGTWRIRKIERTKLLGMDEC